MGEMQGKTAVVTGASSGIGRATARLFYQSGAQVVLVARRESLLSAIQADLGDTSRIQLFAGDVTNVQFREKLVARTLDRFARIDVLVNAAGILESGKLENTEINDWERMFQINVTAVFHMMQLCLPALKRSRGNIVNVSSITGLRAFPGVLAYCSSKAALDHMTRCAALELAADGVRVNGVNPGVIMTNLHRAGGMAEEAYQAFLERSKETHPMGRVGSPEEVAQLVYYLASEKAAWITGVNYAIDGGRGQTCLR